MRSAHTESSRWRKNERSRTPISRRVACARRIARSILIEGRPPPLRGGLYDERNPRSWRAKGGFAFSGLCSARHWQLFLSGLRRNRWLVLECQLNKRDHSIGDCLDPTIVNRRENPIGDLRGELNPDMANGDVAGWAPAPTSRQVVALGDNFNVVPGVCPTPSTDSTVPSSEIFRRSGVTLRRQPSDARSRAAPAHLGPARCPRGCASRRARPDPDRSRGTPARRSGPS